jgi:hypothetical protein
MSTEQNEPPVDSRIIFGGLAVVAIALLFAFSDPIAFLDWVIGFSMKAFISIFVAVVTAIIVMVFGGLTLGIILAIGQLFGYSDD